jgi:hypothetical protein
MCTSSDCEYSYESHIELAIAVFKTHDIMLVKSLKNFLTLLPNSICIEQIFKTAIQDLAKTDLDTYQWLKGQISLFEANFDMPQFFTDSIFKE